MIKVIIFILVAVVAYIIGFCMGGAWIFNRNLEVAKKNAEGKEKFRRMFGVLNCWMKMRYENRNIADYLQGMNYVNVAIYGMGYLGKHLLEELNGTAININYIIDRSNVDMEGDIGIYNSTSALPDVDVIIVTAIADFDEIADELESKVSCPIISLEDIIYEF